MKPTSLHVVAADEAAPESVADRVRRLQIEAKQAAAEHVRELLWSMSVTHGHAAAIAAGGEAYHPGDRAVARDVCRSLESQSQTLQSINSRRPS